MHTMKPRYQSQNLSALVKADLQARWARWQSDLSLYALTVRASLKDTSDFLLDPIFIVGTGRSGTHFLCSLLNAINGLSDYYGGSESPHMFGNISDRAFKGETLTRRHLNYYKTLMRLVYPNRLVDQTHPNLWHVEQLIEAFPSAKFIALSRDVYSVVNSMLSHVGTSSWIDSQASFRSNDFLGITEQNLEMYQNNLSRIQRFTFRWKAHQQKIESVSERFPSNVICIRYEHLGTDLIGELRRICQFLDIPLEYKKLPQFSEPCLYKKDFLSDQDKLQIEQALEVFC